MDDEFILYCELNKIEDIEKLAKETFKNGFSLLKYPEVPDMLTNIKTVEKEILNIESQVEKDLNNNSLYDE